MAFTLVPTRSRSWQCDSTEYNRGHCLTESHLLNLRWGHGLVQPLLGARGYWRESDGKPDSEVTAGERRKEEKTLSCLATLGIRQGSSGQVLGAQQLYRSPPVACAPCRWSPRAANRSLSLWTPSLIERRYGRTRTLLTARVAKGPQVLCPTTLE